MWLYDSRKNTLKCMTLHEISDICGVDPSYISRLARNGKKLKKIGCYFFKEKPSISIRKKLYEAEEYQGEIWKPYQDSKYLISNYGRVKKVCKHKSVHLMPYIKTRYMLVKILKKDGKYKEYRVRDLVAQTYLKVIAGADCIMHKNGDYTDCSVWNIERVNRSVIAKKTGGKSRSKAVVLVDEDSMEIINWWSSARKAALDNFLSHQAIADRCNGKVKSRKEGYFLWEDDYEEMTNGWRLEESV